MTQTFCLRKRLSGFRGLFERGTGVSPVPCASSVLAQAGRLCHRQSEIFDAPLPGVFSTEQRPARPAVNSEHPI